MSFKKYLIDTAKIVYHSYIEDKTVSVDNFSIANSSKFCKIMLVIIGDISEPMGIQTKICL